MCVELDKLKFSIQSAYFDKKTDYKKSSILGARFYTKQPDEIIFTVSGKFMSSRNNLGAINKDNYLKMLEKIDKIFGIKIAPYDFLYNSQILALDVKIDITVERQLAEYISTLNETFLASTRKNQILIFEKDLGVKEGLLIKPSTITTKTSLSIYSKYRELIARRHDNPEYFNQFTPDFLESCKKILRFECRFSRFKDIRKAFNLPEDCNIHPNDILYSNVNVIYNHLNELKGVAL